MKGVGGSMSFRGIMIMKMLGVILSEALMLTA